MGGIENIIYNKSDNGNLTGGYSINKIISNHEMMNRMYYGGGNNQIKRFDDLIVPLGLMTTNYKTEKENLKIIIHEDINENIFNNLFESICKKRTSYKKRGKINNKTKKK
jgi:N-acetylneuraminic acid mutarotase|tara:strand:- start:171 stop:500 length:330 start_codon:yes stop_codon:yes gene_type:complete